MHTKELRQIVSLHTDIALERGQFCKRDVIESIIEDSRFSSALSRRDIGDMQRAYLGGIITEILKGPAPEQVAALIQAYLPDIAEQFEFIPVAFCIRGGPDAIWLASWKTSPSDMRVSAKQRIDLGETIVMAGDQIMDLSAAVESKGLTCMEDAWKRSAAAE